MAYQSKYFTDLPKKVVDLIEEDIAEKFDVDMGDSKLHGDALIKVKETHKMRGFQLLIGWVVFYGIIFAEQTEKTFYII